MSLCLWSVCMSAALREDVPGALVYSAILSFIAVSWQQEGGKRMDAKMDEKDTGREKKRLVDESRPTRNLVRETRAQIHTAK